VTYFFSGLAAFLTYGVPVLIAASWLGYLRAFRQLPRKRAWLFFVAATAASIAYFGHFALRYYFRRAHLGFWPEVHVMFVVGNCMILLTLIGAGMAFSGRGYARVACISANVMLAIGWFVAEVVSF